MSKYLITRTRKFHPLPGLWNGITQTGETTRKIHGAGLSNVWLYAKDGQYTYFNDSREFIELGNFIKQRLIDDRRYLKNIYPRQLRAGKELVVLARKIQKLNLKRFSQKQLFVLYLALRRGWIKHDILNVPPWHIGGDYFFQYLRERLKREYGLSDEELAALFTPLEPSFSAKEELAILELALEIKKHRLDNTIIPDDVERTMQKLPSDIKKEINRLVDLYYWIPFGYDGPAFYDVKHYLKSIKELLPRDNKFLAQKIRSIKNFIPKTKVRQKTIRTKHKIFSELWEMIKQTHKLTAMTDQRKEFTFQAHVAFDLIIDEISKRLGVKKMTLKYLALEELKDHLHNKDWLLKSFGQRYPGPVMYHYYRGKLSIIIGKELKVIEREIFPTTKGTDMIYGIIASKGKQKKTTGRVRVLSSAREAGNLVEGEILVTAMTTPEFVPAMRISKAIITDEGGMTCHAAIVSRELNLPCIIGTKNATKVLKDGDLVEVDAEKGIVNIIKKG